MCFSCGLLGKYPWERRLFPPDLPVLEAPREERESGHLRIWRGTREDNGYYSAKPICFAGIQLNYDQVWKATPKEDPIEAVKLVLMNPRACPEWVLYQPPLDPRWHREHAQAQRSEADRRRWEAKLQQDHAEVSVKISADNKQFLAGLEEERRKLEDRNERWPRRLFWPLALLAAAEVAGNIVNLPRVARLLGLD